MVQVRRRDGHGFQKICRGRACEDLNAWRVNRVTVCVPTVIVVVGFMADVAARSPGIYNEEHNELNIMVAGSAQVVQCA